MIIKYVGRMMVFVKKFEQISVIKFCQFIKVRFWGVGGERQV